VIDPATRQRWDRAWAVAVRAGRDVAEVVDGEGLLVTSQRRTLIVAATLRDAQVTLSRLGASEVMRARHGRVHGTPADMFGAVEFWLETYLKGVTRDG